METTNSTDTIDTIEHLGRSLIQHGPFNQRIYLMKLDPADMPGIVDDLLRLAEDQGYTKITAKVAAPSVEPFLAAGFRHEAYLPGFYPDGTDAFYMGCFLDPARANTFRYETVIKVINAALRKPCCEPPDSPGHELSFREMEEADAPAMSALYRRVFATYPFPIFDPGYIVETMRSHIYYFGLEGPQGLRALASMETDPASGAVEMSDFATEPAIRGGGAATFLLGRMEKIAVERGFRLGFSIARSTSYGMNITFARTGYRYTGTMVNNTNIAGHVESMNVWFKRLAAD